MNTPSIIRHSIAGLLTLALCACGSKVTIEQYVTKANEMLLQSSGEAVILTIPAGEYKLCKAIHFENIDHLTIEGAPGATTILSGEADITNWTNDPERPGVLVADLSGIADLGEVAQRTNRIDLYCDGQRQQLARWPNKGFTTAGKALGATDVGDTWIHVHGTREGVFEYTDERIAQWGNEKDAYLHGYWYWDWAEECQHLDKVDAANKTITLNKPYHHYGYRDGLRYYGLNLLCELDEASEYYIDREARKIYWKPCDTYQKGSSRTTLSVFNESAAISLLNCKHVTLRNLTIKGVRNKGIVVSGGENVTIENCRISCLGDNAITLDHGRNHHITGCQLTELGCGGIVAKGGNRTTLEPSGFVVSDNVVDNFSLYKRTYEPAILFHGAGIDIKHNRFQHSSSSAMRLEGNDINVEFNQCFDVVNESDDQGGIDTFFDFSYRRLNISHNHWRNIVGGMFAGAAGVRFDDIISGHSVTGNIFENCGGGHFGAVQINGGKDITIEGNVFYGCQAAGSCNVWSDKTWEEKYNRPDHLKKLEAVNCFSDIYLSKYPELREEPASARNRNYLTRNLIVNFKKLIMNGEKGFISTDNTLIKQSDKPLRYFLQPEVLKEYGIPAIPFEQIGPRPDHYMFIE